MTEKNILGYIASVRSKNLMAIFELKNVEGYYFQKRIILQAVYFKLRFGLSYRDVEELLVYSVSKK